MKNLTAFSLSRMEDRLQLGEISYLPTIFPVKRKELVYLGGKIVKLLDSNKTFRKAIPADLAEMFRRAPYIALMMLSTFYRNVRGINVGPEPEWVKLLPLKCRRYMRIEYWRGEGTDPRYIVCNTFSHKFGYIVEDCGFLDAVVRAFNVDRLGFVRQLAFLRDPVAKPEVCYASLPFKHNRLCHTLDVVAILQLLIAKNPVLEKESKELLAAGMGHDAMTPAGGDATKSIAYDTFCEEKNFHRLLEGSRWRQLAKDFAVDSKKVEDIVLGKGLLGEVLDLADKASYMAGDANQLIRLRSCHGPWHLEEGFAQIERIFEEDESVCAVWQHTTIEQGRVVIEDGDALEAFLRLRALLFRWLYLNPKSRIIEQVVTQKVINFLYKTGKVTYEDLVTQGDTWLEMTMQRETGFYLGVLDFSNFDVKAFANEDDARRYEEERSGDRKYLTFVEKKLPKISDGTGRFCVRKGRRILPFSEARPDDAKRISGIVNCRHNEQIWCYVVPMNAFHIRDEMHNALQQIS